MNSIEFPSLSCGFGRRITALSLIAAAALTACGDSDSAEDSAPSTTATTAVSTAPPTTGAVATSAPTTQPTATTEPAATSTQAAATVPESTATSTSTAPTTVPDTRPLDETAQALALAGTLVADDFPEPWTLYSPGGEFPPDPSACSYRPDGPTTRVARGGGQFGPTMQFGDTDSFVSSAASVFADEADAMEFITIVNTDEWGTCRAEQLQQTQLDNGFDDITVQVTSRTSDTLGQGGFEAYAEFSYTDADGNLTRVVLISYYRIARTVITVIQEYGALSDAESTTFLDDTYNALSAAYDRVNALQ